MRGITGFAAAVAVLALAGCEGDPGGGLRSETRFSPGIRQPFQEAFQVLPFAEGPISVVSENGREPRMRTYRLVPCGEGRVCGGSAHGPVGHVTRGDEFWEVTGAYPGRVFYLSPGGDGYLMRGHQAVPLAWNSVQPGH